MIRVLFCLIIASPFVLSRVTRNGFEDEIATILTDLLEAKLANHPERRVAENPVAPCYSTKGDSENYERCACGQAVCTAYQYCIVWHRRGYCTDNPSYDPYLETELAESAGWRRDLYKSCAKYLPLGRQKLGRMARSKKNCMHMDQLRNGEVRRSVYQRKCTERCFDMFGIFEEICKVGGKKCTSVTCNDSCNVCTDKYKHCANDRKVDSSGSYMKCMDSNDNWHRVECSWEDNMLLGDRWIFDSDASDF